MDNTVYTVDYFIKKFESIPENNWLVAQYANHDNTKCCALGHCNERTNVVTLNPLPTDESEALSFLFGKYLTATCVTSVNDGLSSYKQDTPKQRILAALRDIKAKQQPEVKERIVYVTVDTPVRELQKVELMEN